MNKITGFLYLSLFLLSVTAQGMYYPIAHYSSNNQLFEAAKTGNLEKLERLIDLGASLEAKDNDKCTPLFTAVCYGREAICRFLIKKNAAVNARGINGWTPIACAALNNRLAICKLLIEKNAVIDSYKSGGETPLMLAAKYGYEDMCRMLVENNAAVDAKSTIGWTPLAYAAFMDREPVSKLLIGVQLEQAKAAILTFLGIVRKRREKLPCDMQKDIAQMIAHQVFDLTMWRMIDQINKLDDKRKATWLAYVKQQMIYLNSLK